MKLSDYLSACRMSEEQLAHVVGCDQSTINRLIGKDGQPPKRRPSLELMEQILVATDGAVTPNDFVGPEYEGLLVDDDVPPGARPEFRRAS